MKIIISALICLCTLSFAAVAQAAPTEVECGDHWFNVTVNWDQDLTKAEVSFGGDGGSDRDSTTASVAIVNRDLKVTFTDTLGGYLTIEGFEDGQTFGMIRETTQSHEYAIAPCYRR